MIVIDEPNLLKYESEEKVGSNNLKRKIKPSASALFINRSNSFCHHLTHPESEFVNPNGTRLNCVLSDDTFVRNRLRRTSSKSCLLHGSSHTCLHILADSFVQRSNSEVKLCRKKATTRINMASQSPPMEASAADSLDNIILTPKTRSIIEDYQDARNVDEDRTTLEPTPQPSEEETFFSIQSISSFIQRVDSLQQSLPQIGMAASLRRMTSRALTSPTSSYSTEKKRECSDSPTFGSTANLLPSSEPKTQSGRVIPTIPDAPEPETASALTSSAGSAAPSTHWEKPQLDRIFSHAERFGSCNSHLATDFSRALLHNLLQRGKDANLQFEASRAGTFFTVGDENEDVPKDASVEELATKIVQRIKQVKESGSKCGTKQFLAIKDVFEKVMSTTPALGSQLQTLKDIYEPMFCDPPSTSLTIATPAQANETVPFSRLDRMEDELKEQAHLLYQMLSELEGLKAQQMNLAENCSKPRRGSPHGDKFLQENVVEPRGGESRPS